MSYYTDTAYCSDNAPDLPPAPEAPSKTNSACALARCCPHDNREVIKPEYAYNYVPSQEVEREKEQEAGTAEYEEFWNQERRLKVAFPCSPTIQRYLRPPNGQPSNP